MVEKKKNRIWEEVVKKTNEDFDVRHETNVSRD